MKVTLIGTGGGIISENRTYPAYLINDDILIDCGEGTTQKLIKLGVIDKIRVICISHLHNDHFMGIFSLLWYYWIKGRSKPIKVIGPPTLKSTIDQILELANTPRDMGGFELNFLELENSNDIQEVKIEDNYLIKAVKVEHGFPAYAYSVDCEGLKITYSGDTKPNDRIEKLAQNSNLFICEATFPDKFEKVAHKYHHCSPSDAAKIAKTSHSEKLVLVHISPIFIDFIKEMKKSAEKLFQKDVIIGKDLEILKF
jgi:ribonuclease Z